MSESEIIRGITEVDPCLHIAISDYRGQAPEGEGVHVIEIANGPAQHLGNLILCFGRWITSEELTRRQEAHATDPDAYAREHIQSLSH